MAIQLAENPKCRDIDFREISQRDLFYLNDFTLGPATECWKFSELLDVSPQKIRKRLALTEYGWCRMGSIIFPPSMHPSKNELSNLLTPLNIINQNAGRPIDTDLFIRTAATQWSKNSPRWTEPAFLVSSVGTSKQKIRNLTTKEFLTYDQVLQQTEKDWLLIHTDNYNLQRTAIHGRLQVDLQGARLYLGTNMLHAREIDDGVTTKIPVPFRVNETFFDMDSPVHRSVFLKGDNLSTPETNHILNNFPGIAQSLVPFMEWIDKKNHPINSTYLESVMRQIRSDQGYVAEFRYYTHQCNPDERFHVMDVDAQF